MTQIIARESKFPHAATGKFSDPRLTADGKRRATVQLTGLQTLWINTGTLCNLTCENCYIESSPSNDRLVYISRAEVRDYLTQIEAGRLGTKEIGFTGGEPFMNPDILLMLEDCLQAGYRVLVLTNAMRPMMKCAAGLVDLNARYGPALTVRVSVDHYQPSLHQQERGPRSWLPMMNGLRWLADNGFNIHIAARTRWGGTEAELRAGFENLFRSENIPVNAMDPTALVLFPEMDVTVDVPEITTECWDLLGVRPEDQMCAASRMVVKRRGAKAPEVVACTLLPYHPQFSFGSRLADSLGAVALNHPHCAKFCVLGGGSCTP